MVTLLLEILGLVLIVASAVLIDWRLAPAVVGFYLLATTRTSA